MTLSEASVKRPVAVSVLMLAAVVLGIFGFTGLPVNLLPDIVYPSVRVNITWRGASPEEIEDNIAEVVEPRAATVDDLDYLESSCTEGSYGLTVNFVYSADRDAAFQDVLAKISQIRRQLPKDADEPLVMKMDPSQLPVIELMVSSEKMNLVKLRSWSENYLVKQFTAVEGTADADITVCQIWFAGPEAAA